MSGDIAPHRRPARPRRRYGHQWPYTQSSTTACCPTAGGTAHPVTQAASFGRLVTDIDMTINRSTDQPTSISGPQRDRHPRRGRRSRCQDDRSTSTARPSPPSRTQSSARSRRTSRGQQYLRRKPRLVTSSVMPSSRTRSRPARRFAFMNPGGIRATLLMRQSAGGEAPGQITYGEASRSSRSTTLSSPDMTGQQIKTTLEQSWHGCFGRTRRPSSCRCPRRSTTSYDTTQACGSRITAMSLNGTPLAMGTTYKVAMNNFLADGGDSFPGMKAGTEPGLQPGLRRRRADAVPGRPHAARREPRCAGPHHQGRLKRPPASQSEEAGHIARPLLLASGRRCPRSRSLRNSRRRWPSCPTKPGVYLLKDDARPRAVRGQGAEPAQPRAPVLAEQPRHGAGAAAHRAGDGPRGGRRVHDRRQRQRGAAARRRR